MNYDHYRDKRKVYNYIKEADDDKIKNIYDLFEDQMSPIVDWSEYEDFVAELNDRVSRWEEGIDKGKPLDEFKASSERMKNGHLK